MRSRGMQYVMAEPKDRDLQVGALLTNAARHLHRSGPAHGEDQSYKFAQARHLPRDSNSDVWLGERAPAFKEGRTPGMMESRGKSARCRWLSWGDSDGCHSIKPR